MLLAPLTAFAQADRPAAPAPGAIVYQDGKPVPAEPAGAPPREQWPQGMVYVPAGSFIMGSEYGDADESPKRLAHTGAFYIDVFEISNAEYKAAFPEYEFEAGKENMPAVVTWDQARAYAEKLGKRLPTETEWEKAARGTDGRIFPWGDKYDPTYIVFLEKDPRDSSIARPRSPYGCADMAGSAYEWTDSWYQPYPGNEVASENYGEKYRVLRGGTTFGDSFWMRCSSRFYLPPNDRSNVVTGFRCVKDAE
jgi:formylglycine-generating enzyme required for sulfatase activity